MSTHETRTTRGPTTPRSPDAWRAGDVWAPLRDDVRLWVDGRVHDLSREGEWWVADHPLEPGSRYGFVVDGGDVVVADPRSRWQRDGVFEPSIAVTPRAATTSSPALPWRDSVLYELHVATFSEDGYLGVIDHLDHVVGLGATHVEIMPIAAFPGRFGWGYDGVALWSPHPGYGTPDDLAELVDACHARGLAVIVDVVLNHLGPEGNRLGELGPYFTDRYTTPWGDGFNLDGPYCDEVRAFLVGAALEWITAFGADGLRVDAAHAFVDTSAIHILEQLGAAVAELGERTGRDLVVVAEWDREDPRIVRSVEQGGYGFDAQWADAVHHSIHVALTGESTSYYMDFTGGAARVADAIEHGYGLRGRYSRHHLRHHGREPDSMRGEQLVVSLQNHDQVGNRAAGERLHHLAAPSPVAAAAALVLLGPWIPLIFAGEEWQAGAPFPYFADHGGDLGEQIRNGRLAEFAAFGWNARSVADPTSIDTFASAALAWDERRDVAHAEVLDWYTRLLALRRRDVAAGEPTHVESVGTTVVMERGDLVIAANLGEEPFELTAGEVLASWRSDGTALGPGSAVVQRSTRSGSSD